MGQNFAEHITSASHVMRDASMPCEAENSLIDWRTAMTRSSILIASVLTLIGMPPLLAAIAGPASAQEQEWGNNDNGDMNDVDLRDLLRDWAGDRPDRRDLLMDMLENRQDRRADRMERMHDRMDRREQRRERISNRWDDDEDGSRRGRLRERLAERRDGDCYFLTRSLTNEDRSLIIVVRRRVCRD
jgi:hypothetical protein